MLGYYGPHHGNHQPVRRPGPVAGGRIPTPSRLRQTPYVVALDERQHHAERLSLSAFERTVTCSSERGDMGALVDGDPSTWAAVPKPSSPGESWVQVSLIQPMTARTIVLTAGPGRNGAQADIQVSDDGNAFRQIGTITFPARPGPAVCLKNSAVAGATTWSPICRPAPDELSAVSDSRNVSCGISAGPWPTFSPTPTSDNSQPWRTSSVCCFRLRLTATATSTISAPEATPIFR